MIINKTLKIFPTDILRTASNDGKPTNQTIMARNK